MDGSDMLDGDAEKEMAATGVLTEEAGDESSTSLNMGTCHLERKGDRPTKMFHYESKLVVEEAGRQSIQNIQISSTCLPHAPSDRNSDEDDDGYGEEDEDSRSGAAVDSTERDGKTSRQTWLSCAGSHPCDMDTTTYLHLNLLTEFARSKCVAKQHGSMMEEKREHHSNSSTKSVSYPGPSNMSPPRKPLRKARYSWQVKNLSLSLVGSNRDSVKERRDETTEPPAKKRKLLDNVFGGDGICDGTTKQEEEEERDTNAAVRQVAFSSEVKEGHSVVHCSEGQCTNVKKELSSGTASCIGVPSRNDAAPVERHSIRPVRTQTASRRQAGRQHGALFRWQNQHLAKSIVDNAINATLEVLGLSPSTPAASRSGTEPAMMSPETLAVQRQLIEDDAVSAVIRARGLQRHRAASPGSAPEDTANSQPTAPSPPGLPHINPIISHLSRFSDTMLSSRRPEAGMTPQQTSSQQSLEAACQKEILQISPDESKDNCNNKSDENEHPYCASTSTQSGNSPDVITQCSLGREKYDSDARNTTKFQDQPENPSSKEDKKSGNTNVAPVSSNKNVDGASSSPCLVDSENTRDSTSNSSTCVHNTCQSTEPQTQGSTDIASLFAVNLQTDLLDQAVSAAISDKGLTMDG